jgi:hypothetical protein
MSSATSGSIGNASVSDAVPVLALATTVGRRDRFAFSEVREAHIQQGLAIAATAAAAVATISFAVAVVILG